MAKRERLKIDFKTKSIKGNVKGVTFREGDSYIHYIPSLNLSSYGKTKDEATEMMKDVVLRDFCESVVTKPVAFVMKELKKLGWEKSLIFGNELSKSTYIDRDGILRDFELSPDTIFEEQAIEVC